jgi:hypothetical protein
MTDQERPRDETSAGSPAEQGNGQHGTAARARTRRAFVAGAATAVAAAAAGVRPALASEDRPQIVALHDQASHQNDIMPDAANSNQAMGPNYLEQSSRTTPSTPAAGSVRYYVDSGGAKLITHTETLDIERGLIRVSEALPEITVSVSGDNNNDGRWDRPKRDPIAAYAALPFSSGGPAGAKVGTIRFRLSNAADIPTENFDIAALNGGATWNVFGSGLRLVGGPGQDQTGNDYVGTNSRKVPVLLRGAINTNPLLDLAGVSLELDGIAVSNTGTGPSIRAGTQNSTIEVHIYRCVISRGGGVGILVVGASTDNLTIEDCIIGYNVGDGIQFLVTGGAYPNAQRVVNNKLVWNGTFTLGADNNWTTPNYNIQVRGGNGYSPVTIKIADNEFYGTGIGLFGAHVPQVIGNYIELATLGPDPGSTFHRIKDRPFITVDVSPDGSGQGFWTQGGVICFNHLHQSQQTVSGYNGGAAWTANIPQHIWVKSSLGVEIFGNDHVLGGPNGDFTPGDGTTHLTTTNPLYYVDTTARAAYVRLRSLHNSDRTVHGVNNATFSFGKVFGGTITDANAGGNYGEYWSDPASQMILFGKRPANPEVVQNLVDGATVAVDVSLGTLMQLSALGSRTIAAPTNAVPGMTITIYISNGTGGSITTTWNSVYKLAGGTWTDPATGKLRGIMFKTVDGINWREIGRTTADL